MQSLIAILSHPYLITNRVAEAIYAEEEASNAIHQRLRARIKGRHHFTVEDYKAVRKVFRSFIQQLERLAKKLEKKFNTGEQQDWLRLMHHPWLNHKNLLTEVGQQFELDYYGVYDGLRYRKTLPKKFIPTLIEAYKEYTKWIKEQLEVAKIEKKEYRFSVGRGGGSHRGEE